ncbi:MAG: monovalent cation/H(+) antiporter subunit G [Planctomycetota bacterium]|nr:MAG: monovalent cation/H(+) antiporter subunit G [Planctomycetota bacterium]REJ87517.1 MAG: monovalent cation/H(+) antiporter subunit G [Planctomycetota bacterium]REK31105.1 MAG: monovalent cation/H(+) antiporter subunit G [Planctomycetota bacterium]REK44351.1 MAG: monovalent cation/H(+) antiporter subunit G [Planctomycetota bacterium]
MIAEYCALALTLSGTAFLLLAGIGILRLPDLFSRASATTKAATLGVGCLLAATAIHFGDLQVTTRALAIVAFLLLTAPVSAHMLARAAYRQGVPLFPGTKDELAEADDQA